MRKFIKLRDKLQYLLLLPAIISVGIMVVGLSYLIFISFVEFDPLQLFRMEFTFSNYIRIITEPVYLFVMLRTLSLSFITSLSCVLLAIPYAYLIIRTESPRIQKLLIIAVLTPFFIGEIIKAYGWLVVFGKNGLLTTISNTILGLEFNIMYTPLSVYIGLLHTMLPLAILIMVPSVAAVPRDTEMAAQNLGATPFKAFSTVILPQIKPGIIASIIVTFTLAATEYAVPDLLGGGLVNFVANTIYNILFNALNYPLAMALSVFLTAIISIIVYVLLKFGRVSNVFLRGA